MRWLVLFLCSVFLSATCQQQPEPSEISILFVGNSLTYTNDLPVMVASHAKTKGVVIHTEMVAYPNYALEDHWNDGQIQKLIAKKKYTFVVVQQGPSSQMDGRTMLLDYGTRLATLCKQHNSRLSFFMVWPAHSNFHMFEGVIENYTNAASVTNSLLCPVGKRWKDYMDETGDFSYYGSDGFHPSEKGSRIAAEVICSVLLLAHTSK